MFNLIKEKLLKKQAEYEYLQDQLKATMLSLKSHNIELTDTIESLTIVREVSKITQENLSYKISEIVNTALDSIFPDKYIFEVEFVDKNNRTSAEIYLKSGEDKIDIMTSTGGGLINIVAFALRITLLSIQTQPNRKILILDEPFSCVSVDMQNKISALLQQLSTKLNIQFVIVSHTQEIISDSDNCIHITQERGVSKCT